MQNIERLKQYSTRKILGETEKYEIATVREFLDFLGKPDEGMVVFHISGTSGKGSTSTLLSSLLRAHKLKTGLFVSPHVTSVCERIQIDNEYIPEPRLDGLLERVFEAFDAFVSSKGGKVRKLTYFEWLLVCALLYFQEEGARHVVLEVGVGGKMDPTNVLKGDYCILTNIGLDHQKILGDTVEKIAEDKMQIVKSGSILITGVQQPSVKEIVKAWGQVVGVKILWLDKEFGNSDIEVDLSGTQFVYRYGDIVMDSLMTNLVGKHQANNLALALTTFLEFAKDKGVNWTETSLNQGLKVKNLPGRFEIKSRDPLVIWDGAHNGDKMHALFVTLDEVIGERRLKILLAVKSDKDAESVVQAMKLAGGRIDKIVLTNYKVQQDVKVISADANKLKRALISELSMHDVEVISDAKKAYETLKNETKENEVCLVTGSFYLLNYLSDPYSMALA